MMGTYLKGFGSISGLLILLVLTSFSLANPSPTFSERLVSSAQKQIGLTNYYDPTYRKIGYPGGDVPMDRGVCTDVIIRALRDQGIDLQLSINQHMKTNWKLYPNNWGLTRPDPNIDHRRVPNISTYFMAKNLSVSTDPHKSPYLPGDIVIWDLGKGVLHIGLVSDSLTEKGDRYMVIHNICCGVKEEDILMTYKIVSHFRLSEKALKEICF
jgi:uncharacterized protein